MNFDHFEAIHAARDLGLRLSPADVTSVDASVHPPFTDIRSVQTVIEAEGVPVALGAQNCAVEDSGAYTGEVSPMMLAKLHVEYVIIGHSERRRYFAETDELVAAKLQAVIRNGMTPICCVGESEEERAEGRTKDRLDRQVEEAIRGLAPESVAAMVVAYEPIWAIGTGQAATAEDAQEACSWIREIVGRVAGAESAATVRIQYGGSVTGENTGDLMSCSEIDGLLVGGASLDASAFVAIVKAASNTAR